MTDFIEFNIVCYGKIPAYNDFIRYQAGHPVVKSFDRWIQFGIQLLFGVHKKRQYQTFDAGPTFNFIYTPDVERGILTGVLHPSRDAVQRRYPLVLGAMVESGNGHTSVQNYPIVFSNMQKKVRELVERIRDGMPKDDVLAQLQELDQISIEYQKDLDIREPGRPQTDWHGVPVSLIPVWLAEYLHNAFPGTVHTPLAVFWTPDGRHTPIIKDDPLKARDFVELIAP